MTITELIAEVRAYRDLPDIDGAPVCEATITFAVGFLQAIEHEPGIPLPHNVSPISTGVYIGWGDAGYCLYFEVDDESLLAVAQIAVGGLTAERQDYEDATYDVPRAVAFARAYFAKTKEKR